MLLKPGLEGLPWGLDNPHFGGTSVTCPEISELGAVKTDMAVSWRKSVLGDSWGPSDSALLGYLQKHGLPANMKPINGVLSTCQTTATVLQCALTGPLFCSRKSVCGYLLPSPRS